MLSSYTTEPMDNREVRRDGVEPPQPFRREGYGLLGSPMPGRRDMNGKRKATDSNRKAVASTRLAAGADRPRSVHLPAES